MKALKALSGKALEGVPLFSGQMDQNSVVDWIDNIENHFECDGIYEAQNGVGAPRKYAKFPKSFLACSGLG